MNGQYIPTVGACEVPVSIELGGAPRYGGKVCFIANDWQAGLPPNIEGGKLRIPGTLFHKSLRLPLAGEYLVVYPPET